MADSSPLPPMPPSDEGSLRTNRRARQFWKDAEIIRIKSEKPENCEHEFINNKGGIKCSKCYFELLGGQLEARDGQAFAQGKQIVFPK